MCTREGCMSPLLACVSPIVITVVRSHYLSVATRCQPPSLCLQSESSPVKVGSNSSHLQMMGRLNSLFRGTDIVQILPSPGCLAPKLWRSLLLGNSSLCSSLQRASRWQGCVVKMLPPMKILRRKYKCKFHSLKP